MVDDDRTEERTTNPNRTIVTVINSAPKKVGSREACLVVIYGDDLGRRVALAERPAVLGRSSKCDMQVDQEAVSRNHCRISCNAAGVYSIRDLGSTNGTYVNDELVDEVALKDGDQIKVGRTILKFIVGSNIETQYHEEIYRLMTVDGLTEVHNKRFFHEAVEKEISRCKRYERAFSLVLFDIDHFKKINDTYGHLAGDAVLRQLGGMIAKRVRRDDVVARIGGEEFGILLPEVPLAGGLELANKLRTLIESTAFHFEGTKIDVTVSLGIAEWTKESDDPLDLIRRADEKLYEAKRNGRNQAVG